MRFEVTPASKTDTGSRVYDAPTRYHLINLLLSEWMEGSRDLTGICDYLSDEFEIYVEEQNSCEYLEERIAQPVRLSVALDPNNADAFFTAVKGSVTVKNLTSVVAGGASLAGFNEEYPYLTCPDLQ
jgi:hypothetical protein